MRKSLCVSACLLLGSLLVLGVPGLASAKHAQHFTPPDVFTVRDIPYPATTVAAGVVTLAVNLDGAGQITNEHVMISSAWVRVRHEEKGETLKTQFQQAITSCIAAGQ